MGILRLKSIWQKLPLRWKGPIVAITVLVMSAAAWGIITDLTLVAQNHQANAEHVDQYELYQMVQDGETEEAFDEAFELGDELFETDFNALDGGGANVGQGQRFTRIPRADLTGPGQWANHIPPRATGPNGTACNQCHSQLFDDGSGTTASNVHRDPLHSGVLSKFIQRNTPHLFAPGALQSLAEEMTTTLLAIKEQARVQACSNGQSTKNLNAKGVSFGSIKAIRTQQNPCLVNYNTANVKGVASDLIIRPFQWKGNFATLRAFNRDASHNELGMQAVEIVGDDVDGDADGVTNEMTIGDQTALAVYLAAQPRPTSSIELAALGLIDPLPASEVLSIGRGAVKFVQIGCAGCHVPVMKIDNPVFSEPSQDANYRDAVFPAGQDPIAMGCDPAFPVSFDLTEDQPDNIIHDDQGNVVYRLGSLRKDGAGKGIVELFGDLKRHNMGPGLAEGIDEVGTGASNFLTENLWGVGSTAPYMHDGRATTITEAILEHGGEALASKNAFTNLSAQSRKDVVAFLNNLVLFKMGEIPPPPELKLVTPMIKKQ
jgi:cytochrome c peroxidase